MSDDYYDILGVPRTASEADIQKAYREMARKYHPDLNPEDESARKKFQDAQRAYEVLNDPKKRSMYDKFGSNFDQAGGPGQAWQQGPGGPGFSTEDVDLSEILGGQGGFAEMFRQFTGGRSPGGRGRRRTAAQRGKDIRHELAVPLHTIVDGGEVQVMIRRATGQTETISVKVPKGIESGRKIRLRAQGEPSPNGGKRGDILITIREQPHPCFRRRGANLEVDVPITLAEAVSGAKVDVPSPHGTITMTIPPATSSGKKLRAKGLGIASGNDQPGDLIAIVQIVLPKDMDDGMVEQIQQLKLGPQAPRSELRW